MTRAYVVHLTRAHERWEHLQRQLESTDLDYSIVDAVDGRSLSQAQLEALVHPDTIAKHDFTTGVIGCALSHFEVYRRILDDDIPFALVLEDDIVVAADLGRIANEVGEHLRGAEVALLFFGSERETRISRRAVVPLPDGYSLASPVEPWWLHSTVAYVVTREACQRLVDAIPPVRYKADHWGLFVRDGVLESIRCVVPQPVHTVPDFRTTLDYSPAGLASWLETVNRRKIFPLHQLMAARRGRALRRRRRWVFVDDAPVVAPPVAG